MSIILFLCWLIFNGRVTLEIVLVGLAMSALVYLFMYKFLAWSIRKDIIIAKFIWFAISYFVLLIFEIIKASIATIGIMFNEKVEVQPVVVKFESDIEAEVFRVLLANSITLTPGTITVSLENKEFEVHALDESFAVGLNESTFVARLRKADKMLKEFKGGKS